LNRKRMILRIVIGAVVGAAIGYFVLYRLIGCATGTCPITRDPYISTIFGAVAGMLMAGGI